MRALGAAADIGRRSWAVGDGRFSGGQIVCPFHGWRWNLDGTSSFVFHEEQFAPECVRPDDLKFARVPH